EAPAGPPAPGPRQDPSIIWMPRNGKSFREAALVGRPVPRQLLSLSDICLVLLPPATIRRMQVRVLAFVLAGGKGTRLYPLTKERAKPAVPFGGRYRIIDLVLSNLVNSGIYSI